MFGEEARGNGFNFQDFTVTQEHMQYGVPTDAAQIIGSELIFLWTAEVKHKGLHFPDILPLLRLWVNKKAQLGFSPRIHCGVTCEFNRIRVYFKGSRRCRP